MFDPNELSTPLGLRRRPSRLAIAVLLAMTAAAPVLAQEVAADKPLASADPAKDPPTTLDKVEVTGSRLRQEASIRSIIPVTSYSAEDLQRHGVSTLADIARVIPQFGPSTSGNAWTTLMGVGPSPGLASRSTFGVGGLNLVSTSLGGATLVLVDGHRLSASGQAFSGQGNLEGFDLNGIPMDAIERIDILPGGASSIYGAEALAGVINIILKKSDYQQSNVSVRYDSPFHDGGGQVKQVNVSTNLRRGNWSVLLAGSYGQGDALKRRDRWFTATRNLKNFGGTYDSRDSYLGAVWAADGSVLPGGSVRVAAIPAGSGGDASAADFAAAGDPAVYDSASQLDSIDPWRSKSFMLSADYAHADWLNLHFDLRLNEKVTTTTSYPQIGYYYPGYSPSSLVSVPAGTGGNPYATAVYLNKVFTDLPQSARSTARNPAATVSLDGDFGPEQRWHYSASVGWARSEQLYDAGGDFNTTVAANALTASLRSGGGPILIYDSASGNPNAPGVLESYMDYQWNNERTNTYTVNASLSGKVLRLPAGDVQVVGGVEYLDNRAHFEANPTSTLSDYLLAGSISRDNKAVFGELQVPLISPGQQVPLVDTLEANASVRRDDYNDVGSAVSPRYALLYRPIDWVTLRGSRSEGFKPASMWNLYAPYNDFSGSTFHGSRYNLHDPVLNEAVGTVGYFIAAHPDLKPTTSVSHNIGLVLAPPFLQGLTISVDYTRTRIDNTIGSVEYQDLIDDFPDRVVRDASGKIVMLDTSGVNLASSRSKTIDWTVAYHLPTERFGQFSFNAGYSRPISTQTQATATSVPLNPDLPKRASGSLAWQQGPLGLSLAANWQGAFDLYPEKIADFTYQGYLEITPRVAYTLPAALGGLDASLSIINLFDDEPSLRAAGSGNLTNDYRGRRWALELKKSF